MAMFRLLVTVYVPGIDDGNEDAVLDALEPLASALGDTIPDTLQDDPSITSATYTVSNLVGEQPVNPAAIERLVNGRWEAVNSGGESW